MFFLISLWLNQNWCSAFISRLQVAGWIKIFIFEIFKTQNGILFSFGIFVVGKNIIKIFMHINKDVLCTILISYAYAYLKFSY